MQNCERLTDQKVDDLLHELHRKKVFVKVCTKNRAYEKLTVITAVNGAGVDLCFQIDPPEGLLTVIKQDEHPALIFEFANDDRLPHQFEAAVTEITDTIWLQRPDHIQRFQLRNNFRIIPPDDVYAVSRIDGAEIRMPVENISLGGALCHCPNSVKPLIVKHQIMDNMDFFFTLNRDCRIVTVDQAIVRRLEGRARPKHFGVAFEFVTVQPEYNKRLTRIIYDLQRDFLRKRIPR